MKITRKMKNKVFAMPAAADATPPKPKAAAINAMIKNITAHVKSPIFVLFHLT